MHASIAKDRLCYIECRLYEILPLIGKTVYDLIINWQYRYVKLSTLGNSSIVLVVIYLGVEFHSASSKFAHFYNFHSIVKRDRRESTPFVWPVVRICSHIVISSRQAGYPGLSRRFADCGGCAVCGVRCSCFSKRRYKK